MATRKETVEFILKKLRERGSFEASAMFGEYALYADGKVVGLICDNLFYVKIVPASGELEKVCEKGQPYPGAKPHYIVDEGQLVTIENLPAILTSIAKSAPARNHAKNVKSSRPDTARVEDAILKNLQVFVAFARNRLNDHHLAEDVVQESLVKALAADRHPETEEETIIWFYRILRRSIIDIYRKQGARSRALERFEKQLPETLDDKDEREFCKCFRRLLPLVPEQYRELLEEVDLKGNVPEAVAEKLGVTTNNLTVRLHRARKHLRKALTRNCGACSVHGCLDCTCGEQNAQAHCH